ncbi:hypothetical protein, conserved [Leishmania tarentolae]|uniref:Uncharacterized protein n=1 Tax=Leishmania tarentolae TaxID=5689 RepID=A0A640KID3_LEITA|nr:hypothetical protein, conserved [Leishmania tarentolae]
MRHMRGSGSSSWCACVSQTSAWLTAAQASMQARLSVGKLLVCTTAEARRWTSTTSSSSMKSLTKHLITEKRRLMAERASARSDNVSRLRELLQACPAHERITLLPKPQPHPRRDLWPLATPVDSLSKSPSASARIKKSVASNAPRFLSSAVMQSAQQGVSCHATADAPLTTGESSAKGQQEGYYSSPRWYGAPPGAWTDVTYFTANQSSRWNALFHDLYYIRNEPTVPLLRCPACVGRRLCEGMAAAPPRAASAPRVSAQAPSASSSSRLWMSPPELQRHLSFTHADELFTPHGLKLYNTQVLHELRYSCGLAPAPTRADGEIGAGVAPGARKAQPARVILVADVANVELGAAGELLEMLVSPKLLRIFTDFPMALCATHELFVPVMSKTLHTLYQLARLHPASTLHIFFANTSLESGDLLTSSYLNDLLLASPHCTVPPVVLLTADLQQQRALKELHGAPAHGIGNGGHVHWVKPLTAAQLVIDLYAALESSQFLM